MNHRRLLAALLVIVGMLSAGCTAAGKSGSGGTITVYSASGLGPWYGSRFEKFTEATGIKVRLFEAGSGEVVSRVNSPGVWRGLDSGSEPIPPADLLVTLPPFIQRAEKAGLLQASGVDTTGIAGQLLGPGGAYVPIVRTALCFIANQGLDPPPATWDDLLRPGLKGKLQYSTPGEAGDGTAVLLLLQQLMGRKGALDYLVRLKVNNVGPSKSTSALQPKVSSGELLVANGDVQMNLASIHQDGSNFRVFFPAMPDNRRTTVALAYVAGVTAGSEQPDKARELLAFLLSDDSQRTVLAEAYGIPVKDSIAAEIDRGGDDQTTPTGVIKGVDLWVPDWNAVLAELDGDLEAYRRAVG